MLFKSKLSSEIVEETIKHLVPLVKVAGKKNADGSQKKGGVLGWEAAFATQSYALLRDNVTTSEMGAKCISRLLIKAVTGNASSEAKAISAMLADYARSCPEKTSTLIMACVVDVCNQLIKEEKENSNALQREVLTTLQSTLA